jgi:hypothetical protein
MKNIGRNDPCPCGSGKKFKKCHMGREDELSFEGMGEISIEMSHMITSLPEVSYGRSGEMKDALDIKELTESSTGIKFVDLKRYIDLSFFGSSHHKASKGSSGGVFINLYKTVKTDPDNIYIAISRDIDDSTLMPGTLQPLSFESEIPVDHLEHPEEFGYWLKYLKKKFDVQQDADDAIISYLYENGMLIQGKEIQEKNIVVLKSKSDSLLKFLSEKSQEIDTLIRDLPGYIGSREVKE